MPTDTPTAVDRPRTPARAMRSTKPELLTAAIDWHRTRERRRNAEIRVNELKAREEELRRTMVKLGLRVGETIVCGRIRIKRELRDGSDSFRLADARKSGVFTATLERVLRPFITPAEPHERWSGDLLPQAIPAETES